MDPVLVVKFMSYIVVLCDGLELELGLGVVQEDAVVRLVGAAVYSKCLCKYGERMFVW